MSIHKIVGQVSERVENLLALSEIQDKNIYFSSSNLEHMKKSHPEDFEKYGSKLSEILEQPDYVGKNPKDDSIEYVKVAVRLSNNGKYFARSLYVLNKNRVKRFIEKGTLKKT